MGTINREWHLAHKMPKNPTMEQRIAWHLEHTKHCTCRAMPDAIAKQVAQRKKPKRDT